MSRFKKGDKVVCLDVQVPHPDITAGREYEVRNTGGGGSWTMVSVTNDRGSEMWFDESRFDFLPGHEPASAARRDDWAATLARNFCGLSNQDDLAAEFRRIEAVGYTRGHIAGQRAVCVPAAPAETEAPTPGAGERPADAGLSGLWDEIFKLHATNGGLQARLTEARVEIDRLRNDRVKAAYADLDARLEAPITVDEAKLARKDERIRELEKALADARATLAMRQDETDRPAADLEAAVAAISQLAPAEDARLKALEWQIDTMDGARRLALRSVRELRRRLDNTQAELAQAKVEFAREKAEVARLQEAGEKLKAAQLSASVSRSIVDGLKHSRARISAELDTRLAEIQDAHAAFGGEFPGSSIADRVKKALTALTKAERAGKGWHVNAGETISLETAPDGRPVIVPWAEPPLLANLTITVTAAGEWHLHVECAVDGKVVSSRIVPPALARPEANVFAEVARDRAVELAWKGCWEGRAVNAARVDFKRMADNGAIPGPFSFTV